MHQLNSGRHVARLAALLFALTLAACGAPTESASAPSGPDALLGVWVPESAAQQLLTAAGQPPPLNAEAAELHAVRLERLAAGDTSFDQTTWCASPGMPRVMTMPYPFEIRLDGDFLAFIHGWYRWHRVVNLTDVEVDPPLPLTMGFPVGHWEGDTLVIRTVGLIRRRRARRIGSTAFGADGADRASARAAGWASRGPHHRRRSGNLHTAMGDGSLLPSRRRCASDRRHLP